MSSVQVSGNASGTGVLTIQSPNTNTNYTLTLPSQTGTVVVGANANSVTLPGSTSGTMSIAAPAIAGSNTATLPAATGTVMVSGNMPAFSAYLSSAQSLTLNVATKITFQTEEFDTASCYDNSTNYRFTPTVAGYYQVNASLRFTTAATTAVISVYKNGASFKFGAYVTSGAGASVSALVYLNGSTDYIEAYGTIGSTQNLTATADATYFQAAMVRAA